MSRAPRAPLVILLIAAAHTAGAQQDARPRALRTAAVTGTIYDSIARAPLSRAVVYLSGTSHTGSTDRSGRFQLDGVPAGRYQVAFTHPVLDTLGIAAPQRSVEVRDGGIAKADLYVPSMWSMVKRLCPAAMPREASGLVLGVVRDAETDEPVGAATVTFSWTLLHLTSSGLQERRHRSETLTQTDGVYAMCGVPSDVSVTTRVEVRGRASGEAEVRVGEYSLVRRDLSVAVPPVAVATVADSGAPPAVAADTGVTLVGFV